MHEAAGVSQGNDTEINDQKGGVGIYGGQLKVADTHQKNGRQHERAGTVAGKQVPHDGTVDGAFGARQRKSKRGSRATESQIFAQRQEEHGESEAMQPAAEDPQGRGYSDHAPAVEQSC